MELQDVTSEMIKSGTQIVIVDFDNNGKECLTFLVTDCAKPEVPGYPARSLTYYNTVKEAREDIIKKYEEVGYPKNDCYKGTFTSSRR